MGIRWRRSPMFIVGFHSRKPRLGLPVLMDRSSTGLGHFHCSYTRKKRDKSVAGDALG